MAIGWIEAGVTLHALLATGGTAQRCGVGALLLVDAGVAAGIACSAITVQRLEVADEARGRRKGTTPVSGRRRQPVPLGVTGDLNGDGLVDIHDLEILMEHLGESGIFNGEDAEHHDLDEDHDHDHDEDH